MSAEDYQKEAQKYKELYEKYQKLAQEAKQKNYTNNDVINSKPKKSQVKISSDNNESKDTITPEKQFDSEIVEKPWKGTNFGLGGTIATGDSATTNVNALLNINYNPIKPWNNKLFFNYIYSTDNRESKRSVKINKSQVKAETSWDFNKKNGTYGRLTYLNDELSSYQYIFTESLGYKRNLFENKSMNLSATAGPSFLQSKKVNQGQMNGFGMQATVNYVWNFTDKSNFKQNFLYNFDQTNKSIYQSISALSVELYKDLSLQLTFQLDGTTLVAPGKHQINTITSTNIMYNI
ncbi:DUF481 domain-containing protein [Francisella sciaenopsi]|uniref:DUF481 domain-containing protein n=1 Tax=Francisella sciaenopsi TaxID=3055034 RepID=A0ABQ6PDZ9_9GAMM